MSNHREIVGPAPRATDLHEAARVLRVGDPRDFSGALFEGTVETCFEYILAQPVEVHAGLVVMSPRWLYSPTDTQLFARDRASASPAG